MGQRHAGHYRTTAAAKQLRYNTYNIHGQCVKCNRDLSGNIVEYRIELKRRIGEDRILDLEHNNERADFDPQYLKRLKRIFNRRAALYRRLAEREQQE